MRQNTSDSQDINLSAITSVRPVENLVLPSANLATSNPHAHFEAPAEKEIPRTLNFQQRFKKTCRSSNPSIRMRSWRSSAAADSALPGCFFSSALCGQAVAATAQNYSCWPVRFSFEEELA